MSGERDNVFATRMTLGVYKIKVKGARKGYELLKRKADALKVRLRRMMNEIKALKTEVRQQQWHDGLGGPLPGPIFPSPQAGYIFVDSGRRPVKKNMDLSHDNF